jgi:hypothetical protein
MANVKTPEVETRTAGDTTMKTAETAGRAVKDTSERIVQRTTEAAERAMKTASEATERTTNAAVDNLTKLVETTAHSIDGERIVSATRESLAKSAETQQQALVSIERAGTSILTGMSEIQKEIAGFVSERIRQDLETQRELFACRTIDDVREVQSRFLRTTIDQYSAETSKLMQLGAEVFARAMDPKPADA